MPELLLLALSFLLVVVCLTAVLITAIPAFQELARAGRSVTRLAETLSRELPPTLEAIRLTGLEISELSDELNQGAKNASEAVKQVNEGIKTVRRTTNSAASSAAIATRSALAGLKAGWQSLRRPRRLPQQKPNRDLPKSP